LFAPKSVKQQSKNKSVMRRKKCGEQKR